VNLACIALETEVLRLSRSFIKPDSVHRRTLWCRIWSKQTLQSHGDCFQRPRNFRISARVDEIGGEFDASVNANSRLSHFLHNACLVGCNMSYVREANAASVREVDLMMLLPKKYQNWLPKWEIRPFGSKLFQVQKLGKTPESSRCNRNDRPDESRRRWHDWTQNNPTTFPEPKPILFHDELGCRTAQASAHMIFNKDFHNDNGAAGTISVWER